MIELTNGEIRLRPLSSADRKQWRRVRAINREWLEEWEATVPNTSKNDELKALQNINKAISGEIFENLLPPKFVFVENLNYCCFCASRSNLQPISTKQVVCKQCIHLPYILLQS